MPMTLLEIVREHAGRQGLPLPASVIGNTSGHCQQISRLVNEFCDDLNTRKAWQETIREAVWTSTATESQGPLSTLAPLAFEGIVEGTVWDRSERIPLKGGLSAEEWQLRKASAFGGPYSAFRLRGGEFLLNPPPAAGHTMAFEYYSSAFVFDPLTSTFKKYWSKDTDTSVVDDSLTIAYLRWAWKKEKGLEYAEDFAKYERMFATKSIRNDAASKVDLSCSQQSLRPGVFVPTGNWPLP